MEKPREFKMNLYLNVKIFVIFVIALISATQADQLHAGYGVLFSKMGVLIPSTDEIDLSFVIDL